MKDWQASIRINFIFAAYELGLLKALSQPCSRNTLVDKLKIKRLELFDSLLDVGLASKELAIKNEKFFIKGKRSKAVAGINGDMLSAIIQASVTYYSDAYKNAAADVLNKTEIITKIIERHFQLHFEYPVLNDVMNIIKQENYNILNTDFGIDCKLDFSVRKSEAEKAEKIFNVFFGVEIKRME